MSDQILDQTRDISGRETHRLLSLYGAPDFVKTAGHEKLCGDPESLQRHMYADPYHKLYPCHTAPATWMSALFFSEKKSEFTEKEAADIQNRLDKAAAYFGIAGLVGETREKVAADAANGLNKLDDTEFAIVWADENGGTERHWPIRNANEVKFAAAHFAQYRDDFTFADRNKIANKILDKAAEYNADIPEQEHMLEAAAGRGMCAAKVAAQMLQERSILTRRSHSALSAELAKLAVVIAENPDDARSEDCRLKLASVVDSFDRETKLFRLYDSGGLARPEEILFAITEKVARDFTSQHVQTTTGNVYALDDLEKLAVEEVRSWMGDDFVDAVSDGGVFMDRSKLAAIVPTLDRGMAATLDRLLAESGTNPAVKTAEETPLMSADRLYELANQADQG